MRYKLPTCQYYIGYGKFCCNKSVLFYKDRDYSGPKLLCLCNKHKNLIITSNFRKTSKEEILVETIINE